MSVLTPNYTNLNYDEVAKKIGLKASYMPMLIESFLEESRPILENLKNSIASKNYDSLKSQAHSIKGSAGNLRLDEIYEMAKNIELAAVDKNSDFQYKEYVEAIEKALLTL